MATLKDLKPSISQMTPEEKFALIKELRFQRRQVPPKKQGKKKLTIKQPLNISAVTAALTKEQKLELLKQLEGI